MSDLPDWAQTEDNWDGYGAKPTLPAVIEAVERQRPIWESFGLKVIPYSNRALAEDLEYDSIEWREDGSCPVLDEIERLRAENDLLHRKLDVARLPLGQVIRRDDD